GIAWLNRYDGSLSRALQNVFPEYEWHPWRFRWVPSGYWNDMKHQRQFVDWMAKELNVTSQSQWYGMDQHSIVKKGGGSLLIGMYGSSLARLLQAIYPEMEWQPWRFKRVPSGYFNSQENQHRFFEHIANQLQIRCPEEWYNLKYKDFILAGGKDLLKR